MNPLQPRVDHSVEWNSNSDAFGLFASRGLPPPKIMSPAEVRRLATDRAGKISKDHRKLQAVLERHEAVIQRRWEKKTRTQRVKILLEAWPNMPTSHRPEFAAFRKHPKRLHEAAGQYRDCFMWPYINQEDLGKPKTLPLLLNARGWNHPSVFAAVDGDAMHLGNVSMVLAPIFLNGHVMLLNGMAKEGDYGKLLSWDDHEDAFYWMHTRKQFIPGEGLAILEAQNRLLEFFLFCCEQILHEIPSEELLSDAYPVQPGPLVKANDGPSGLKSLAILAEEAPYRVSASLDLANIKSLLTARAARAKEHVWALREDPDFAEAHFEAKEHRQEILKDAEGNLHPTMKFHRENILWARIIGSVVFGAGLQVEMFSQLRDQARNLTALRKKYTDQISPLEDIPEEYLRALLNIRHCLLQTAKGPLDQLKMVVVASPPFWKFFVREVPISASSSKIAVRQRPGVKMDTVSQSLFFLQRTLWEDERNLFLFRLPVVVDELERLVQSDQKARDLVSPYVAYLIGELSIVGECLRQLQVYQPWANGFESALTEEREGDIKNDFAQSTRTAGLMMQVLHENNLTKVCGFASPLEKKFDYPVGRRRNKATVEALRYAEANLDLFWTKMDDLLCSKVKIVNNMEWRRLLPKPTNVQRTPEWVEPARSKDAPTPKASQSGLDAPAAPFASLQIGEPVSSGSVRKEILVRTIFTSKPKSRGHASSTESTSGATPPALVGSISEIQPKFAVNARALKVFRIVFFDPSVNTTAGEVVWNGFLHAMSSVGFAARKLYGSVWHFQPTKLDFERSIQFHEPHPQRKIPFLIARRYGRRLTRAYGWSGDLFVLRDKTG